MRKSFACGMLVLGLVAISLSLPYPGYAEESKPPYHIANKFSRTIQSWSGVSLLASFLLNRVVTYVVQSKVGGHVQTKVGIYSLTDLLAGKIRSVNIFLKGSHFKGIPLGELSLCSINPLRVSLFSKGRHKAGLKSPILLAIQGSFTEGQLAKALENPLVASKLKMVKLDLPGLGEQSLQLVDPTVRFENGLVKVQTLLVTKGAKPESGINLSVTGKPVLRQDSQIILEDMQVNSPDIISPDAFSEFSQSLLNPLIDFRKMDRSEHAFRLTAFKLVNEKLDYSGNLLLAPKSGNMQLVQRSVSRK